MASLFCCPSIQPYRPAILIHEPKFKAFMDWSLKLSTPPPKGSRHANLGDKSAFVIQLVRQVNFGPLESKRYFASFLSIDFTEVTEEDLIAANYKKLNAYKNFKCNTHNKFFELNVYEKDPINKHHWRANIARPAAEIDLPTISANASNAGPAGQPVEEPMAPKKEAQRADSPSDLGKLLDSVTISDDSLTGTSDKGKELDLDTFDNDDDARFGRYADVFRDGSQSPQDFTACSLEDCGYCGHCEY